MRRIRRPLAERGVSLIELMVGLALGLVVIFALATLFEDNSRVRRHVDQATQQIENGRYALDLLRDDLHLAGYYGNAVPISLVTTGNPTLPDPCATTVAGLQFSSTPPSQWPVPVFGIAAGDTVPGCVSGATGGHKAGTDILVVRRTKTVPTGILSLVNSSMYLQATGCNAEGQQHKNFALDLGSGSGTFVLHKRGCADTADIYEFQTRIYYVSNETIPTLRLLTLSGATSTNEPLVEGIDDMRIDYGTDTAGNDGTPDAFTKCRSTAPCDASAWANVMAVRVHLLARNIDALGGNLDKKTYTLGLDGDVNPSDDRYRRHVFSSVVRLMNPAGRREL